MDTLITSIPENPIVVENGEQVKIIGIFNKGWHHTKSINLHVGTSGFAELFFIFLGSDTAAFPLDFVSVQNGTNSRVRIAFRSILFDSSFVKESAIVRITPQGNGSDAVFSHHILLLSDIAHGTTIPSLEIETSNSTAKHAASITTLDVESLYYLNVRGCDESTARTLLIRGFVMKDLDTLINDDMRKRAEYKIDSFLQMRNYV